VTLAVCATPIGNLDDVTLRVLAELRDADVVLCEDTRRTRTLLARHGIDARLVSYHEHNEAARTAELLPRLEAGERMALVSDAGLPGVSDPGARIVRAALDAGVAVTVLPGASAVETALVASGLVGSGLVGSGLGGAARYEFVGFLPRGAKALAELWSELGGRHWPVVAFESAQRLPATLRSLATADPEREAAVCRELTKRFEEVARGTALELAERFHEPPKGEVTVVLAAAGDREAEVDASVAAVRRLVAGGAPRRLSPRTARTGGAASGRCRPGR